MCKQVAKIEVIPLEKDTYIVCLELLEKLHIGVII